MLAVEVSKLDLIVATKQGIMEGKVPLEEVQLVVCMMVCRLGNSKASITPTKISYFFFNPINRILSNRIKVKIQKVLAAVTST